jgi:hypothetical protein
MKKIEEETGTSAIPSTVGVPTGKMPCSTPYFNCNDDMFFNLHLKKRKNKQWFDKFYKNTDVAAWARKNKGKDFYLKHEDQDMFRKVKAY